MSPAKLNSTKPKKKCCKSSTRCMRCPVVLHRLQKADADQMSKKQFTKALKKARAA